MAKMNLIRSELHCHTLHSDGSFTFQELIERCEKNKLEVVALTDHNTISGHQEFDNYKGTIALIKGMEWTTFFGHVLLLNCNKYHDWRFVGVDEIDDAIKNIKSQENILIGIAHPKDIGDPISSGSHWDYKVNDYSAFDYMEVWHVEEPYNSVFNDNAKKMWIELLDSGIHMTACNGRDWHRDDAPKHRYAMTYLLMDGDVTVEKSIEAIKNGRVVVSVAPKFNFNLRAENTVYELGDTISKGNFIATFDTQCVDLAGTDFEGEIIPKEIILYEDNFRELLRIKYADKVQVPMMITGKYIRAELVGTIDGNEHIIAFTNAIYVK